MTRGQIEARFNAEVKSSPLFPGPAEQICMRRHALAFCQRIVAELQAPPTGEEVEKAWNRWEEALTAWSDACNHNEWDLASKLEAELDDAVRDYGAACRAAGRAEVLGDSQAIRKAASLALDTLRNDSRMTIAGPEARRILAGALAAKAEG